MAKITFEDKVALNPQPSVANINKVSDADMNEIKSSVNTLYDYHTYSSTEQVIGVWEDGKPLYRKVIEKQINANTNSTDNLSTFGIINQNVVIIDVGSSYAKYTNDVGGGYAPIVYNVSSTDRATAYINGSGQLSIQNQNGNQRTYVITLLYTKTTD